MVLSVVEGQLVFCCISELCSNISGTALCVVFLSEKPTLSRYYHLFLEIMAAMC